MFDHVCELFAKYIPKCHTCYKTTSGVSYCICIILFMYIICHSHVYTGLHKHIVISTKMLGNRLKHGTWDPDHLVYTSISVTKIERGSLSY